MKLSNDLAALVFELQRAGTPADKARALVRAWRTVRGLSATERRLLVRELGFDGAEDLVEGLAGKGGGTFAPAAVLEALGHMREDKSLSLQGILAGLRDPEQRGDLLTRGIDYLVGKKGDDGDDEIGEALDIDGFADEDEAEPPAVVVGREIPPEDQARPVVEKAADVEDGPHPAPPVAVKEIKQAPPPGPVPGVKDDPSRKADLRGDDASNWDEMSLAAPMDVPAVVVDRERSAPWSFEGRTRPLEATSPVFLRLRAFRDQIEELRGSDGAGVIDCLESLPEPWAKRRALVALIAAGIPGEIAAALDLIEELGRPMDRSWCLSVLARRGGLEGDDLERALEMLASPAARRRIEALAIRAS
jgi:hypothetical protein